MTRAIFISYRRDDTEGEAGRLFDDLTRAFGPDAVFMDVAGIDPGSSYQGSSHTRCILAAALSFRPVHGIASIHASILAR